MQQEGWATILAFIGVKKQIEHKKKGITISEEDVE